MADCYASLNPPQYLWAKYLAEIERLETAEEVSPDDYNLLRYHTAAKNSLMDLTLGGSKQVSGDTILKSLDQARAAIRAEPEAEVKRLTAELGAETAAREAVERQAIERLAGELEAGRLEAAELLQTIEAQRRAREMGIRVVARRVGWYAGWVSLLLVGASVLAALIFSGVYFALPVPVFAPSTVVLALLYGVLSFTNLFFGWNARYVARKIDIAVADYVERVLLRLFQPSEAPDAEDASTDPSRRQGRTAGQARPAPKLRFQAELRRSRRTEPMVRGRATPRRALSPKPSVP